MSCPVHIWVPLVAAAAPFARVAKDRVAGWRLGRGDTSATIEPPRELKRWAPVGAPADDRRPDGASS